MTVREMIGHNIKVAREEIGMTGAELGERVEEWLGHSWPRQTVSMVESGKRAFAAEEVLAIAFVLRRPISYFYFEYTGDAVTMPSGATIPPYEWVGRR